MLPPSPNVSSVLYLEAITISSPPALLSAAVGRQPLLHDLVTCLAAPCIVLSDRDGQIRPDGAQGAFVADVRVLSQARVTFDGSAPDPISHSPMGPDGAEFVAVVRGLGDPSPDPTVWLRRRRMAEVGGVGEELTVVNRSTREVSTTLGLSYDAARKALEKTDWNVRKCLEANAKVV